jgi:hypothetical protein
LRILSRPLFRELNREATMAWWNNYDRGYYGTGYNRGFGGYDSFYGTGNGYYGYYGEPYYGMTGNYGNATGYGYDYTYRTAPQNSPTYGRGADRMAQRWARRQGYDTGYAVQPHRGQNSNWGMQNRGRSGMGYDYGYSGGMYGRGYDRGWRW